MATAPDPRRLAVPERSAPDLVLHVTIDGVPRDYPLRMDEMSAADSGALRKATGFSFNGLQQNLANDPDLDVIAALAWLSRRQNGESLVSYNAVAEAITFKSVDIESLRVDTGDETETDDPEEISPEA